MSDTNEMLIWLPMTFFSSRFPLCAHHCYVSQKDVSGYVSWFASTTAQPPSPLLFLVLRATTALSAAPRAFTEPTAPRPAPARTTSPAQTWTASAFAKKVPSDLQRSFVFSQKQLRNKTKIYGRGASVGYGGFLSLWQWCSVVIALYEFRRLVSTWLVQLDS